MNVFDNPKKTHKHMYTFILYVISYSYIKISLGIVQKYDLLLQWIVSEVRETFMYIFIKRVRK